MLALNFINKPYIYFISKLNDISQKKMNEYVHKAI